MEGRLIIDGVDAYTTYGVWLSDQGLNELLSWPSSKRVDTVSWAESNGIQADLSDLKLAAKESTISLNMRGHMTDYAAFCAFLAESVYRTWNIASLGLSFRVRYISSPSLGASATRQQFSVRVGVDSPLEGYTYSAPISHISRAYDYDLDGINLTNYGVRVLLGTLDSTGKQPTVKERMKRDISSVDGVIYDGGAENKVGEREIKLQCSLIDDTLENAWRNYYALLYDLVKQDDDVAYDTDRCKRELHSYRLKENFECYYKSQSVTGFHPEGGRIWILFTITLAVIGGDYEDALLQTESEKKVVTETNENKIRI